VQNEVVEVERRNVKPDRDFEVAHTAATAGARAAQGRRSGLRHDNLVVTRVMPLGGPDGASGQRQAQDPVGSLLVLIDTSASRALGLDDQIATFEALMTELRKTGDKAADPLLTVAAFDQDVAPLFVGKASAMGDVVRRKLGERHALGASDLGRALTWAASALKNDAR